MGTLLDIHAATELVERIQASKEPVRATLDEYPVAICALPENAFRITSMRWIRNAQKSAAYITCENAGCKMTLHHKDEKVSYFKATATYDTMLHHLIRPQHLVISSAKEPHMESR